MWTTRATERVILDTTMPTPLPSTVVIDFAAQRGERERAVLALRCESSDLENVSVTFSDFQPNDYFSLVTLKLEAFRQGFVFANRTGRLGQTNTGFGWRETGKFPPLDLPLDVMVELYYDWCWDDVSTTQWPPAIAANNSQKARCQIWRDARAEWEKNHTLWLYNACSPGACGATARSQPTADPNSVSEWLKFAYLYWRPINGRLLFWLPAKLNITGWLHWADNVWQKPSHASNPSCPYEICPVAPINGTMLCSGSSDANGAAGGDGVLLYPGAEGPLSSIRLENIADGFEDPELFRRMKNTTRRDELITMMVQSGDLWTDGPALLERVRREAAASVIAEGSGHRPHGLRATASFDV